jgi:hypothetical protein
MDIYFSAVKKPYKILINNFNNTESEKNKSIFLISV